MQKTVLSNDLGAVGMDAAATLLRAGGSALDAVEQGIRRVEADPGVRHVGLGGDPNLLGEVECDAAVMDGETLAAGAVGALRGYLHAVSVARGVMERLPHVMLVAEGAGRFAAELGHERSRMMSEGARQAYAAWRGAEMGASPHPPPADAPLAAHAWAAARRLAGRDTVIFLAMDGRGRVAAATSTSGISYKYPGRLGDSAVVGAGLYADSRYGACGCTHTGEMTIRAATAVSVIRYMQHGADLHAACLHAIEDVSGLTGGHLGPVAVHALDRSGAPCVMCTAGLERPPAYFLWSDDGAGIVRKEAERP